MAQGAIMRLQSILTAPAKRQPVPPMVKDELLEMRSQVAELLPSDLNKGRTPYRFMAGRTGLGVF